MVLSLSVTRVLVVIAYSWNGVVLLMLIGYSWVERAKLEDTEVHSRSNQRDSMLSLKVFGTFPAPIDNWAPKDAEE